MGLSDYGKTKRDLVWTVLVEPGVKFTVHDVSLKAKIGMQLAAKILKSMLNEGLIEKLPEERKRRYVYRVKNRTLKSMRRAQSNDPHTNMWRAIRRATYFQVPDILTIASTETLPLTSEMVEEYCYQLASAGYVRVKRLGEPGVSETQFQRIKDSGPLPPKPDLIPAMFDPNLDTVVYIKGVAL